MVKRVLVACEFSGVVRQAFRALGHEAFSCDLLKLGEAEPGDRIEAWRGSTKCLSGPVWAAVKLEVKGGRFAKYRSPEKVRASFLKSDGD